MSRVPEEELFKICLEFWKFFARDVMEKKLASQQGVGGYTSVPRMFVGAQPVISFLAQEIYPGILSEVKEIMLDFMAKPKEVLLTIDEDGDVEEEHVVDTENAALYENMRETLIYLTNQDTKEMDTIISRRLEMMKNANKENRINFE